MKEAICDALAVPAGPAQPQQRDKWVTTSLRRSVADIATPRPRICHPQRTLRAKVLGVFAVVLLVGGSATSYAAGHKETGKATSVSVASYDGNYRVVDASIKKFASQKILVAAHHGSATITGKPGNIHATVHYRQTGNGKIAIHSAFRDWDVTLTDLGSGRLRLSSVRGFVVLQRTK